MGAGGGGAGDSCAAGETLGHLLSGTDWPVGLWTDPAVFAEALRRTQLLLRAQAHHRTRTALSPVDAEDLASRVLEDLHAYRDRFRGEARIAALLRSFAERRLLTWLRDRGRRPPAAALDPDRASGGRDPDQEALLAEGGAAFRDALAALGSPCRELIMAYYADGTPLATLPGGKPGEAAATSYMRVWRCRERLRLELRRRGIEVPGSRSPRDDRP